MRSLGFSGRCSSWSVSASSRGNSRKAPKLSSLNRASSRASAGRALAARASVRERPSARTACSTLAACARTAAPLGSGGAGDLAKQDAIDGMRARIVGGADRALARGLEALDAQHASAGGDLDAFTAAAEHGAG